MLGASSTSRRILLTCDFPDAVASEISAMEVYTPTSSNFCQLQALGGRFDQRAVRRGLVGASNGFSSR